MNKKIILLTILGVEALWINGARGAQTKANEQAKAASAAELAKAAIAATEEAKAAQATSATTTPATLSAQPTAKVVPTTTTTTVTPPKTTTEEEAAVEESKPKLKTTTTTAAAVTGAVAKTQEDIAKLQQASGTVQQALSTAQTVAQQPGFWGKVKAGFAAVGKKSQATTQPSATQPGAQPVPKSLEGSAKTAKDETETVESIAKSPGSTTGDAIKTALEPAPATQQPEGKKSVKSSLKSFASSLNDLVTIHKGAKDIAGGAGKIFAAILALAIGGASGAGIEQGVKQIQGELNRRGAAGTTGVVGPSGYPEPNANDKDYNSSIESLAANFSSINDLLKDALDKNNYEDDIFKILGTANSESFGIVYQLDSGAGSPDAAFVPFLVKIVPEQVNGFAVIPSILLDKVSGDAKDLLQALLQPSAELVFTIKYLLLLNAINGDSTLSKTQKIETLLNETALLYSRLSLSSKPLSNGTIRASLPKQITDILDQQTTKMFTDLVRMADDPTGNSKLAIKVYTMRKQVDYNDKINFANDNIIPLLGKDLSYSDWLLVMHALTRMAADLGYKLDSSANQKQELATRATNLVNLLQSAVTGMQEAEFDTTEIAYIKALIKMSTEVKNGIRTADKIIKAPLLGEHRPGTSDISLSRCMDVCLHNFNLLYAAKFPGDYDYIPHDFLYGENGTKLELLAIFLRGVRNLLKSDDFLFSTKNNAVALRLPDGTNFSVNPSTELNKIIKPATTNLAKAQKALSDAVAKLRKNAQNEDNQKQYAQAISDLKDATEKLRTAILNFRYKFSVYNLLRMPDGTQQTVAEFLKKAPKNLVTQSKFVGKIFEKTYAPFQNVFGFTTDTLYATHAENSPVAASTVS